MPLLLVDDRDGRIVAELETTDQVAQVLAAWAREDGSIPDYLCLVEVHSHQRSLLGTDTTVKVRPLLR